MYMLLLFVFFFKHKTAYEMRISDWSSDVCSSDLALDMGVLEGTRSLNYKVQGASALQPSEVSDNGQFTVMRFPNQREIPAIFTVNPDGSEATASFDVRDEFVVIHGVYKELRLRRGKVVLCIYNESPKTGKG